jgi:undecaprenyl-diphosphatase
MKNNIKLFVLGIILLTISFFLDKKIFDLVEITKNSFFDIITNWVTSFITVFVILIFITTLFLWEEKKREYIPVLWLSFISSILISFILKLIVARARPVAGLYYPLTALNYSFPSMHTMVAFTALPILDKEFPNFKWFWLIFAILVAFSRVYTGMHYFSDVVFGALVGYFVGLLFIFLEEKYHLFDKFFKNATRN